MADTLAEYINPKILAGVIKALPQEEGDRLLPKRQIVLTRALERFNERVKLLPECEQKAVLHIYYKLHAELLFGFLMSIENLLSADKLATFSTEGDIAKIIEEAAVGIKETTTLYSLD